MEPSADTARDKAYSFYLFINYAFRRFLRDRCLEAAASLTFTTLLALVPILFIGLAVLSAFPIFEPIRDGLRDLLSQNFMPEAEAAALEFLARFTGNPGRASTVGVAGLFATALILLLSIESAFNAIWRVTERRSVIWRMVAFWAVLTMGPVLLAASLSASGGMIATGPPDPAADMRPWGLVSRFLPPILEWAVFLLIYTVIPNRPVQLRHAFVGAVTAALLLEILRTSVSLTADHLPAFLTVYGVVIAFPVFLVLLFLGWAFALFGAVIAASLAEWGARTEVLGRPHLSPGNRLSVALAVLAELNKASRLGAIRRRKEILRNLKLGAFIVESALYDLAKAKYIARVGRDQWVLTRDLEHATVYDLYSDLKLDIGSDPFRWMTPAPWQPMASEMIEAFDTHGYRCMGASLKELFASGQPEPHPNAKSDGPSPAKTD